MNHSILRGFCQKCDGPIITDSVAKSGAVHYNAEIKHRWISPTHEVEPVWFLSPQQMKIILSSNRFLEFVLDKQFESVLLPNDGYLPEFLESDPFLVAKILKESEKK
jgi:hypothetical protein